MRTAKRTGSGRAELGPNWAAAGKTKAIPIIIAIHCRFIRIPIVQASPHFLMTLIDRRLLLALAGSLLLHGLPFVPDLAPPPPPRPAPPLSATLQALPRPAPPALHLEQPAAAKALPAAPRPRPTQASPTPRGRGWQEEVRKQFRKLDDQGLFYPPEAIAQGLQGEVLALFVLDESGSVIAARVEQGSGHPLLDTAALGAVRALRALPAAAPRETLLPVRFRLH